MAWLKKASLSSSPPSSSSSSSSSKKLTRSKQLRYLSDDDINIKGLEISRSEGSDSDAVGGAQQPKPLPLPMKDEFHRLPSPVKEKEKEKEKELGRELPLQDPAPPRASFDSISRRGKSWQRDPQRSGDRVEVWESSSFGQNKNGTNRAQHKFSIQVPNRSAPTSLYSSPAVSPQRMSTGDLYTQNPVVPQIWSSPEMAKTETTFGFPFTAFQEKIISDTSPPSCSPPLISPMRLRSNASVPVSPGRPQLFTEVSANNREINGLPNGHPLPRPPVTISPGHPLPAPVVPAKLELSPMRSHWVKGKLIGRGTFGSVYIATNRETGATCAMKEVELFDDDLNSLECMRQLEQEIKVLSQLDHPNIVRYYGSEIVEDRFHIYLEYVYPGSVNRYIRDNGGAITESVVRNFTRHILSGLAYLHSTKTIHRDIKGANLLVDLSGVVKLADFGMAKHLSGKAVNLSLKGSPYWMAPELMQAVMRKDSSDLAFAVDIWSLGCTIIEMFTGKPPWSEHEGPAAMFKVMRESPPIPESLSYDGKDFLRLCFQRNPADRPPASVLLEHRFVKNSQQLDCPPHTSFVDRAPSPIDLPRFNLDQMSMSPPVKPTFLPGNESGRYSRAETCGFTMTPRHSPQSTLDTLPSLSPSHALPIPISHDPAARNLAAQT